MRLVRLKDSEAKFLGLDLKEKPEGYGNPKYKISEEQLKKVREYRLSQKHKGLFESCNNQKVDITSVKRIWKKDKESSILIENPLYVKPETINVIDAFKESIEKVLSNINVKRSVVKDFKNKGNNKKALKATTSDDHLGLEPNPRNTGLFKYEYNAQIYRNSYDKLFESIMKEHNTHGTFELLLLDNLGDEQDGYNGFTTRGGHKLEQNMSNSEVFETCIDVKVRLIEKLVNNNVADKIILRKVANDNHSGDFGHMINIAVSKIVNLLYDKSLVEIETLTNFLEHRFYGDHCFILTHGKDKEMMFKGLPLHLNDKTINYINDYIRFYDIKSKYIHLEKGDLHQIGYNKCSTFDYRNFMSFAPPSSWVQHNFGDCYSGYSIQVIPKYSNEISHTDYFLDYKKKK